jgi:hypothetical protein
MAPLPVLAVPVVLALVLFGGAALLAGALLLTGGIIRRNPRHVAVGAFLISLCLFVAASMMRRI